MIAMQTTKLYYEDCHLREFTAVVTGCEKTEKGYLFPPTWKSLITEETKDVTVDISLTETEAEYDKMKLDSEEAFTEQFTKLLTETGLTN